jgi:tetratricopeptide (TPR) repeat protein
VIQRKRLSGGSVAGKPSLRLWLESLGGILLAVAAAPLSQAMPTPRH